MGLYGIAAAGAISLSLRHLVFTPLYAAVILRRPYVTFYPRVVPILAATLATIGLSRLILWKWTISSWVDLGTAAMVVTALFAAMTCLLLKPEERTALKDILVRWRK